MFEAEVARPRRSGKDQWEADRAREAAISSNYEQRLPTGLSDIARWQALDSLREQIRVEAKRLKWASGEMPETHGRLQLLHAKSFVYALDNLERTIASLANVNDAPPELAKHREKLIATIPGLRQVRNSAHHVEDRARGKHRVRGHEKDIILRPMSNRLIHAPGGAFVVDALIGNRYGCYG
jgi:hypothetical protein